MVLFFTLTPTDLVLCWDDKQQVHNSYEYIFIVQQPSYSHERDSTGRQQPFRLSVHLQRIDFLQSTKLLESFW